MSAYEFAGFKIATMELTYSWGMAPASARITIPGDATDSVAPLDAGLITLGGFTFHCVVSANPLLTEHGQTTTIELVDQRLYLQHETMYCGFNFSEVREDNPDTPGIDRQKRWWHIYPDDWDAQTKTYTEAPLSAKDILGKLSDASEMGWTFNTVPDQDKPVYDIHALNGSKLGSVLEEISSQQGLVFTLSDDMELTWCRKGFIGDDPADPPTFPENSFDRKLGEALSNIDTQVRLVGDRNRYQDMPIFLEPSWSSGYEDFWSEPAWLAEVNERFGPYDDDHQADLFAKARSITIREYAAVAGGDTETNPLEDHTIWGEVSRMEMPVWVYLQDVVWKAYQVPRDYTVNGIPLESLQVVDSLMAAVIFDLDSGDFALKDPREYYPEGKAFVIAQGQPLNLLDPRTQGLITGAQLAAAQTKWTATNKFNLDVRNSIIIFEDAVFLPGTGDNALFLYPNQAVDGLDDSDPLWNMAVPNPDATIGHAAVSAVLCWEAERYSKTYGSGARKGAKHLGALNYHALMLSGVFTEEIPYADGDFADDKADEVGNVIVKATDTYPTGGYKVPDGGAIALDSTLDRISVMLNFSEAIVTTVEFAKERAPKTFEHERSLDRKARQHDLFPGQKKNRDDVTRLNEIANFSREIKRPTVAHYQSVADLLRFPVGAVQCSQAQASIDTGKAGQAIFMADDGTVDLANGQGFQGILIHDVDSTAVVALATQGIVPVLVQSPFEAGDQIGMDTGSTVATADGDRVIGIAQFPCSLDSKMVLVPVRLGGAGAPANDFPFKTTSTTTTGDDPKPAVQVDPGWINLLIPDSINTPFPFTDTKQVVVIVVETSGKTITSAVMQVTETFPGPPACTLGAGPSNFQVPIAMMGTLDDPTIKQIVFSNLVAQIALCFQTDKTTVILGASPWDNWYTWSVAQAMPNSTGDLGA